MALAYVRQLTSATASQTASATIQTLNTISPLNVKQLTSASPTQATTATKRTLNTISPLNVRQLTSATPTQTAYAINITLDTASTAFVFSNLTFLDSNQSPFTSKTQNSPNSPGQIEPKTTNSTPEASTQQTRLISAKRPLVVATTGFIADMATQIAGDACEVVALLPPGTDPHTYEAVPGDAALLSRADLIIENGLTLEGWLGKLIRNTGRKALLVTATHGITPIRNADHAGSVDPHAWMDPVLGRTYARNICEALVSLLPDKREELERRWNEYDRQIKETDENIRKILAFVPPEHRIIATTHDAFRYFGNRYDFGVLSLLGTTTDAEIRTGDLQEMVRAIQSRRLPALFVETTLNPRLMQQVARDGGIRLGGKLYADSMGPKGSGADTYLSMLTHNARVLAAALAPVDKATGDRAGSGGLAPPHSQEPFAGRKGTLTFLLITLACFTAAALFLLLRIQRPAALVNLSNETLHIEGLSASYAQTTVLQHFSLDLPAGAFYGLVGPNGSGKSTLFKAALGLITADSGRVQLAGQPLHHHTTGVAYVPQREEIDLNFPATVQDVVLMGRYPHHRPSERLSKEDLRVAERAMTELDILPLRHKPIGGLSGGQQQRAFLARALCQTPQWYLLDEPFTGVDQATEDKILQVLRREVDTGKSVIMIHHDLTRARTIFDKIILINRRLIAFGPPREVLTEDNILKTYSGLQALYDEAGVIHHTQKRG